MLRARTSPLSRAASVAPQALKVLVARDGQLQFVVPESSRVPSTAAGSHALAPEDQRRGDHALIAANRQKLRELHARRYDTVPDFADALVASTARALPRLALLMTGWSLEETGLLSDPAVLAGASAFAFATNWLADRGYDVDPLRPRQAPAGLFYDDLSGLVVWFGLDAVRRFLAAATIDDTRLEDELDAYYPSWSRTDFEWDIRRLGRRLPLNEYPQWLLAAEPDTAADDEAAPAVARPAFRGSSSFRPAAPAPSRPLRSSAPPGLRAPSSGRVTFHRRAPRSALRA
jgi:hypothetical protein